MTSNVTRRQLLRRTPALPLVAGAAALALAGCTANSADRAGEGGGPGANPGTITVDSTDTACKLSATQAASGKLAFKVTNSGPKVTEFYVLAQDGLRIVAEVENVGPGLSRELVLTASPGKYVTACKPGMVGKGIRGEFTVTDSGKNLEPTGADKELVAKANKLYAAYVKDQTEQLKEQTATFVDLYQRGDTAAARRLYPLARLHWERIEPVAESFGDLDPRMDLREADLEPGQKWTGWHIIEKDLWPPASGYSPLSKQRRAEVARQLMKDTDELYQRTRTMSFTADQIGNGAKALLDEVATGKVTGEEEAWSHTDLYDFQANVESAKVAWEGLRPLLQRRDKALDTLIATRFATLQKLLDQHRKGDSFIGYDALTKPQVKALSDAVNALGEPLSKLTAAVLS